MQVCGAKCYLCAYRDRAIAIASPLAARRQAGVCTRTDGLAFARRRWPTPNSSDWRKRHIIRITYYLPRLGLRTIIIYARDKLHSD